MESLTEDWIRAFETAAVEMAVRPHWGQLHQLNRRQVERLYPVTLPKWRRKLTEFHHGCRSEMFSNWHSRRAGLEANVECATATSWGPNRYDVFALSDLGHVRQLWWQGGWAWATLPNQLPGGERILGPIASTSWGPNRIDIFGLGRRGTLLNLTWDRGWRWADLAAQHPTIFRQDMRLAGPLAVVAPAQGRLEVFATSESGEVWRYWFDGRWNAVNLGNRFSGGERFFGSIAAVSWSPNRIDVFGMGSRGQILQLWREGSEGTNWAWSDLSSVLPPSTLKVIGPLGGIATGVGRIDLFAKSEIGQIVRVYWDGRRWISEQRPGTFSPRVYRGGWLPEFGVTPGIDDLYRFEQRRCAPAQFVGPIAAASWGGRRLDVFGFGENGNIFQMWREDDTKAWTYSDLGNGWVHQGEETVNALIVQLQIGRDGTDTTHFRHHPSQVHAVVRLRGQPEFVQNLSNGAAWAPHSLHTRTIRLAAGVRLRDVESFGIRGQMSLDWLGDDDWDLSEIVVNFEGKNASGTCLADAGSRSTDLQGIPPKSFGHCDDSHELLDRVTR